jgi:3-oxoacyl-[acyl-carrier protein] reductase
MFELFDLSDLDAVPDLARRLKTRVGPFYGLVNNAGVGTDGLLSNMHVSQIETLVRVNTIAPIVLTKHIVRTMMTEGEGRIVNMSSVVATTGYSGLSVYAATKASMIGFTKSLAREVGRMGITVNAVAPGFLDTELTKGLGEDGREQVVRRSALRRLAEVDDVAAAVAYLMGEAGRNVTGAVLTVDAGNTA